MKTSANGMHPVLTCCGMALLWAVCLGAPAPALAATSLRAVDGSVTVFHGEQVVRGRNGTVLKEGDEVEAGEGLSHAIIRFDDGARLAVRPGSRLVVKRLQMTGPAARRQKTIRLVKGGLRYISGKATVRAGVAFETSTATIGIRGTDIEIAVLEQPQEDNPSGTYLKVNTGQATLQASDGEVVAVDPGEFAFGGEPELTPRGGNARRRPAARKVDAAVMAIPGLFKSGRLDALMR